MASPRSPLLDGVDPALANLIYQVSQSYQPHRVSVTSGQRAPTAGRSSFHNPNEQGVGRAIDVQLSDPKTGQALANYQDATTAKAYQAFANQLYQQALKTNPALAEKLRWGGYFSGKKGDYGALDLMHFDVGGGAGGVGMKGGSWAGGWTPEMQQYWNMQGNAGAGATGTSMQGPPGPDAVRRAFLASIARGEAPDYNVLYGGGKFSDYSKHPGQIISGPDPFDPKRQLASTAAGKYQFLKSTWDEQAAKYGYKDFSPETQDTAAWNYANEVYKAKSGGRDLATDLSSRDPALLNQVGTALKEVWPSLPGGSQTGKAWEGKQFSDVYGENLGMGDNGQPAQGSNPLPLTVKAQPEKPAASPYAKMGGFLAEGLAGMGKAVGGATPAAANPYAKAESTTIPMAMSTPTAPVSMVDPKQQELQRQQLALAMQRLNTGRLW